MTPANHTRLVHAVRVLLEVVFSVAVGLAVRGRETHWIIGAVVLVVGSHAVFDALTARYLEWQARRALLRMLEAMTPEERQKYMLNLFAETLARALKRGAARKSDDGR